MVLELSFPALELTSQEYTTEEFNQEDTVEGRTPFAWSAYRGDLAAMEYMLQRGANVHKPDRRLRTPLVYALLSGNHHCVKLLLHNDVDVNITDSIGWSPLHRLSANKDDPGLVDILLDCNANIDAKDGSAQCIPLILAICHRNFRAAERLIERGANLYVCNNMGESALSYSVGRNAHSLMELLLKCGVDHIGEIVDIGSFLHMIAEHADITTLRILSRANLPTRDIYSKNPSGLTPIEVARARPGIESKWLDAFQQFIWSVDPTKVRVSPTEIPPSIIEITDGSGSEDEVFVEASGH